MFSAAAAGSYFRALVKTRGDEARCELCLVLAIKMCNVITLFVPRARELSSRIL